MKIGKKAYEIRKFWGTKKQHPEITEFSLKDYGKDQTIILYIYLADPRPNLSH